ncbi:hypothetical protein [Chitinophaga vietnamensis]|uniref:hypothetical protein n=1 Tax=Chitinophaga vietnamensis TaxID=2593957 RepID=UPI001177600D|nr:hypothetical protein [Chitinophaga vietnamensis]
MKAVIGYILMVISAGIALWGRYYHGELLPHGWPVYIAAMAIGLIGLYLNRATPPSGQTPNVYANGQQSFYNDKIVVPLTACEILSNSWTEESYEEPYVNKPGIVTPLTNWNYKPFGDNKKINDVTSVRLVYRTIYNGQDTTFTSAAFQQDLDYIKMAMVANPNTYIYLDRHNPDNYFFDVSCINNRSHS